MKYITPIALFALLIPSKIAICQNASDIRCQYKMEYVNDPLLPEKKAQDLTMLDIKDRKTKFYSYSTFRVDSSMAADIEKGLSYIEILGKRAAYGKKGVFYSVYTDFDKKEIVYCEKIGLKDYYYTEPLETPKWKLTNEHKILLGYSTQKATCKFRGRIYEAWFTPKIPANAGPWKLTGLPGLILEAKDTQGQFAFECIAIQKSNGKRSVVFNKKNYIAVNKTDYSKIIKRFTSDPIGFIDATMGSKTTKTSSSNTKKSLPYNPIEIE